VRGRTGEGSGYHPGRAVGVWGDIDSGIGVAGLTLSGTGVAGQATEAWGINYGVSGQSQSAEGYGVHGYSPAGVGVYGGSDGNDAIVALSTAEGRSGVYAQNTAPSGTTYGVYGLSASNSGYGVFGTATAESGQTRGVWGRSHRLYGTGVFGETLATSGNPIGVYGSSSAQSGFGVYGFSDANNGTGVAGVADNGSNAYGVWGKSVSGYAGYFEGRGYYSGNVGLGVWAPSEKLDTSGTARLRGIEFGDGNHVVVDASGKLWRERPPGSSSQRYKHNVADLPAAGDAVLGLRPVSFAWNSTGQPDIGLIAEEVAEVLPDLVICSADGQPDAVKYDKLALYLLDVVKSQREQISAQENELTRLRVRLERVEAAVGEQVLPRTGGVR
jgi:hypothetical protein